MKTAAKFLAVLFAVFCFVFACEVTQQEKKPLTSSDEMFNLRDTLPVGGVMPQALRVIPGNAWTRWISGDSILTNGFALMSQDSSNSKERIVTDQAVLAWLLGILPDSLSLSGYTDTLTITAIGDSIAIQGSNSLQVPFRVYGVDTLSDIYTKSFPSGSRIINRSNGAQYLVQAGAVSGYTTDSIAVIPTGGRYAALQPNGGNIYFSHVNQSGNDDTQVLRKMMQYAYVNKKISTVVIDEDCYLTDTLMIPATVSLKGTYQGIRTRTNNGKYSTLYLNLNDASKTAITTEDHEFATASQYFPGGQISNLNIEALSDGHTIFRLIRPGWMLIHDIRIGSGPVQSTNFNDKYFDYAFRYDGAIKTKFYDMEIRNCKRWAVWVFDAGGTTYFDNVRLDNNVNGIKVDTSNLHINNCIIENTDSVGLRAYGGNVQLNYTHFESTPNAARDVDVIQLGGGTGQLIMRSVRMNSPFTPANAGLVAIATDDFEYLWLRDCEFHNYPTQLSTTANQGQIFWENEWITGITNKVSELSGVTDLTKFYYRNGSTLHIPSDVTIRGEVTITEEYVLQSDIDSLSVFQDLIFYNDSIRATGAYNLFARSEELNNTGEWSLPGTDHWIVTANDTVAPDGNTTADLITFSTGGVYAQNLPVVPYLEVGKPYTISFYARNSTGYPDLRIFIIQTGTDPETTINIASDEWVRYSVTLTPTATITAIGFNMTNSPAGKSFHLWGMQVVKGNAPGPYVATSASRVTSGTVNVLGKMNFVDSVMVAGLSIISGTAAPAAGLGSQGSLYMRDDDDSTLYTKTGTGWVLLN